jgi:hypothetical protein
MRSGSLQDDRLVVGVDDGGTLTDATVADESGAVLAPPGATAPTPSTTPRTRPGRTSTTRSLGPSTTSQPSGTRWRRQTARTDSSTRH